MNEAVRKLAEVGAANQHYREAPSNIEAEQALLGAILVNNKAYEKVGEFLKPEHFYDPAHQRIFRAIATLIDRLDRTQDFPET